MIKDNTENLKIGLKAEQDTVAQYTKFLNSAKQANNKSEADLWQHIIDDELEHIKELEAALRGDFTLLDEAQPKGDASRLAFWNLEDFENYNKRYENGDFRGSEATPYDLESIKKWISIRNGLSYCDDENTPGEWEGLDIKKFHSKYGTNYIFIEPKQKLWRIYQTGNEFYHGPAKHFKDDKTVITIIPQEEVNKRQQQIEEFEDDIIDCLSDAGIERGTYSLSNEWPHFYVDFDYREDEGIAAYNALRDSFFKCDFVDDDGFYYVHVLRR